MYRLEVVLFLLSFLPFLMACIFAVAVAPKRQQAMDVSLQAAADPLPRSLGKSDPEITSSIEDARVRMRRDFDSLYSVRLLVPAGLLSILYWIGLGLGVSMLVPDSYHGLLCRPIGTSFLVRGWLANPAFAVLGAYTFNTGLMVRRAFMSDFTKNVMWACLNRLIISVGFAIMLDAMPGAWFREHVPTNHALAFAIAFFPQVFFTFLRKRVRKTLSGESTTEELEIQLIQGIDVWKEERLEEEGIESVQNMATADIFGLMPKVHYPMRTLVDWIDQAIFIQRFPFSYRRMQEAGYPVSALRMAAIGDRINPDAELLANLSQVSGIAQPILHETLVSLANDAQVRILDRLWRSGATSE